MRKWVPLGAVALGTLMLLIDVTIVNVAIPEMSADLDADLADLQWVVNAYALALGAVLLGAGGLADRLGHVKIYLYGLGVFAIASLVAGLATNLPELVAARAVQGVGGAAMLATSIALLNKAYTSGKDRGIAFGVWGATAGAAGAIGPVLGGVLTEWLSWRWVFFVNVPLAVLAIALSLRTFGPERIDRERRLDIAGILTFTVAAAAVTYGLIEAGPRGWSDTRVLGSFAVAAIALIGFVVAESVVPQPILDLRLLRNREFAGILLGSALLNFAAFGYLFYTALWLQDDRGMSPISAGLAGAVALALAGFVVSGAIGRNLHDSNPRWIIGLGLLLIAAGAAAQGILTADSSWVRLQVGLVVAGCGVGLATPILVSSAMSAVPVARGGMAAGAVNTARQLGLVFGIALLGTVFQNRAAHVLSERGIGGDSGATARTIASGGGGQIVAHAPGAQHDAVADAVHTAFASGLNFALHTAGIAGLIGAVVCVVLIRRTPGTAPESAPRTASDQAGSELPTTA
ncbi:major facilitator superfamily transporter [Nocardia nova SH22a]|uniref:Major facilitator superfamily transporter n=1 Tax=Nocardia nova SH22a TaxID=1415166 RepID=W5TF73_9NOCA|nr:MFS transporter [Nocardia nova]AHH15876.1 major facilitator superfamily transporter [Nocardia nova SH22a]